MGARQSHVKVPQTSYSYSTDFMQEIPTDILFDKFRNEDILE